MMTRTALKAALAAGAVAGVLLAVVGCSGSGATPAPTDTGTSSANQPEQVAVTIVQCFADHKLIPESALNSGKTSNPPSDSSTWLHDGKITNKLRFGDWYSVVGSALIIKGKTIDDWVTEITASSKAWPSGVCGPVPNLSS
jgi:hypothetical protein